MSDLMIDKTGNETSPASPVLGLRDIDKSFPGVRALQRVSFEVVPGEVHALVGENGAGKSTLISIAAGVLTADSGDVTLCGELLDSANPERTRDLGLSVVYQHTSILHDLTVRENIELSAGATRKLDPKSIRGYLDSVGANIHLDEKVAALSTAERQQVELARALALDAKVLLLDEPTESLTRHESEALFARIREMTGRGTAVVYISHRLRDVKQVADRLTILRDGETRGTFEASAVTEHDILQLMLGREITQTFPGKSNYTAAESTLEIEGFRTRTLHGIDLRVKSGEILGLAGVEGNGQREFMRAIAGLVKHEGSASLRGDKLDTSTPPRALRDGIVYVSGDRHAEGLFLSMSVGENATFQSLNEHSSAGVIRRRREQPAARQLMDTMSVKAPSVETMVSALSGGNQQKVLLGRAFAASPRVILVDEPTRGVDMGARIEIYRQLREKSDAGTTVIALSSDALELQGLCDRVIVFSRGSVVADLSGAEVTEHNITGAAVSSSDASPGSETMNKATTVRRILSRDGLPGVALLAITIALASYTASQNELFLSPQNIFGILSLSAVLGLVAIGQASLMMTGSIDLSVGSVVSVSLVVMSFFSGDVTARGPAMAGIAIALGLGVLIGLINAMLVHWTRLPAVLATLATFIVLEGLALTFRSSPDGTISTQLLDFSNAGLLAVPAAFVIVLAIALAAERWLRTSRSGMVTGPRPRVH